MMGWRVGYLGFRPDATFPAPSSGFSSASVPTSSLADELLKVQDTTIICPPQLSQHLALAALQPEGQEYVERQIKGLQVGLPAVTCKEAPRGCRSPWGNG